MKKIVYIPLFLLLIGCATVGTKIDRTSLQDIQKGQTTEAEIISMFGSPDNVVFMDSGKIYTYNYSKAKNTFQNFVPVVNLMQSKMDVETETFTVFFNSNNLVKDYSFNENQKYIKSGLITD